MSRTIHKYPLNLITLKSTIMVGPGPVPIHAGLDPSGNPCIWCEVDDMADAPPLVPLIVYRVGNGATLSDDFKRADYCGSFVHGRFVWHIYTRFEQQNN